MGCSAGLVSAKQKPEQKVPCRFADTEGKAGRLPTHCTRGRILGLCLSPVVLKLAPRGALPQKLRPDELCLPSCACCTTAAVPQQSGGVVHRAPAQRVGSCALRGSCPQIAMGGAPKSDSMYSSCTACTIVKPALTLSTDEFARQIIMSACHARSAPDTMMIKCHGDA